MKIEAVTVSIDYSYYLRQVISNKDKFDRWIIVTHKSDKDTIRVCKDNGLEYVLSERVFDDAWFAKGRAINDALKLVVGHDWLVNIDADIRLPDNFRQTAETQIHRKESIYGMPREEGDGNLMQRMRLIQKVKRISDGKLVSRKRFPVDVPIGYFQMWHSSTRRWYDEESQTGAGDDLSFALSFQPEVPRRSYCENWRQLPLRCYDVYGSQGHLKRHFYGIRNLDRVKRMGFNIYNKMGERK